MSVYSTKRQCPPIVPIGHFHWYYHSAIANQSTNRPCPSKVPLGNVPSIFMKQSINNSFIKFLSDCGQPPTIPFAAITFDTTHSGSIARYKCQKGFDQLGNSTSVCQPNGKWSDNDLICQNSKYTFVFVKLAGSDNWWQWQEFTTTVESLVISNTGITDFRISRTFFLKSGMSYSLFNQNRPGYLEQLIWGQW